MLSSDHVKIDYLEVDISEGGGSHGWRAICEELVSDFSLLGQKYEEIIHIYQIKEKFGDLCINMEYNYENISFEEISGIYGKHIKNAKKVCEQCGSTKGVAYYNRGGKGWIKRYCQLHGEQWQQEDI